MTSLDPIMIVQRLEELAAAPMGDELAMMDLDTGKYIILDRIAAAVWEELAEPVRIADVVSRLQSRFDVSRERCETDVLAFLEQLRTKGLLRVEGA